MTLPTLVSPGPSGGASPFRFSPHSPLEQDDVCPSKRDGERHLECEGDILEYDGSSLQYDDLITRVKDFTSTGGCLSPSECGDESSYGFILSRRYAITSERDYDTRLR